MRRWQLLVTRQLFSTISSLPQGSGFESCSAVTALLPSSKPRLVHGGCFRAEFPPRAQSIGKSYISLKLCFCLSLSHYNMLHSQEFSHWLPISQLFCQRTTNFLSYGVYCFELMRTIKNTSCYSAKKPFPKAAMGISTLPPALEMQFQLI